MGTRVLARGAAEGAGAAVIALLAMAGTAAVGLSFLDAEGTGEFGAMTAAAVAMAAGGSAGLDADLAGQIPLAVHGGVDAMPTGVALVGAVVLGWLLLRRGGEGLLVRGAAATVAFAGGVAAAASLARGTVTLRPPDGTTGGAMARMTSGCATGAGPGTGGPSPGGELPFSGGAFDSFAVGFSVAAGPAVVGAVVGALAVLGVCALAVRFASVATSLSAVLWTLGGIAAVCLPVAAVLGGTEAAGGGLLFAPLAVFGTVLLGLGVPWTLSSEGALACGLDGAGPLPSSGGLPLPLVGVSGLVLLAIGIVAACLSRGRPGGALWRSWGLALRLAPVVGAAAVLTVLLSRFAFGLDAEAFGVPIALLDAELGANPWHALAVGIAGGAAAGFAASLLVDGMRRAASVSSSTWTNRVER